MKVDIQKIIDSILPVVENLGYELVDVKWANKYGNDTLTVYIFKAGDMSLEDCEKVHTAIDPVIDTLNPTEDAPFNLDVSSMGLDWNMKTDADFNRRLGAEIEISGYQKINGQKKVTGILKSYDKDTITLSLTDGDGKELGKIDTFNRKDIAKAIMAIHF